MPIQSEEALKAEKKAKKQADDAKAKAQTAKLAAANARAQARADRKLAEETLGKGLLAVHDAGDIRPEELAAIGRVLARWKKPTADFYLLADLMPPARPAKPVPVVDPVTDAAAE